MLYDKNINPFDKFSGSSKLMDLKTLGVFFIGVILSAMILIKMELTGAGLIIAMFFGSIFFILLFKYPILGFFIAIALNFTLLGIGRYIKGLPLGFGIDGILIFTYLSLIFQKFKERVDWSPAKNDITVLAGIWLMYCIFQIVNPEARSVAAWVAGRGLGFYFFFLTPLVLILIDTRKKIDYFLYVWGAFSVLATLKGMIQLFIGVDPVEQAWLDGGAAQTHVLFGKLRVFSYYSDAGQFGANQAYTGVVFLIYSLSKKGIEKIMFIGVGLLGFYGMMISGTRGAIGVPAAGMMVYFVLSKNTKVVTAGFLGAIAIFIFFKYTMIGNNNQQIRRMRTAFDPNDKSLQVRLENQKILKRYLSTRPFGGGIGHGGVKAQRFLPNAFLSQVATDSWYVLIWVELGIVGLLLHLFILFYILGKASFKVMFRIRDPILRLRMSALISGVFGVMLASYGNAILGGMPTVLVVYTSLALVSKAETFDITEEEYEKSKLLAA